ncbi:HAD-IA family hydrolase [Insolitispirillum peregrinum]|uniref:Phosphoglycolate phosphatase n=1 Tax=Insolitispirillum peregrinum TaxID=80876 RepID=A0A1N7Q8V3_9PROT|nr:HAD-IA family hydrolase [Insolitispirillum peregrinum]SIT19179.1 phosphoglycolate phosphatase [Insolitispirillum peregrinum]
MGDPLRLVLLDIDGTLVDSLHNIVQAMHTACDVVGVTRPPEACVRRGIGLSLVEAVAQSLPDHPLDIHEQVAEHYKQAFMALRSSPDHQEHLFPGTREIIAEMAGQGWLLGLATGKSRRGLDSFVERHGFEGCFVTLHTADDGPGKPHPSMIHQALANTGCEPHHTVMVGDTTFDIQMARAARVGAVGVSWGNHAPDDLWRSGAHIVLETFDGLTAAVSSLTATPG